MIPRIRLTCVQGYASVTPELMMTTCVLVDDMTLCHKPNAIFRHCYDAIVNIAETMFARLLVSG